jgi:prefoldin subunit 5
LRAETCVVKMEPNRFEPRRENTLSVVKKKIDKLQKYLIAIRLKIQKMNQYRHTDLRTPAEQAGIKLDLGQNKIESLLNLFYF